MTQTVVGIFYTPADAEHAVSDLMNSGFLREKISLITPSMHVEHVNVVGSKVEHNEDLAIGAVGGGLIGGMLGALVGMIVIAIPGIGPVLAAGPLAAAISGAGVTMAVGAGAGAVGGGVLGALTWAGITSDEAHVYEEFIRRGSTLVMVQATRDERERAAEILHRDGAASASDEADEWRHEGLI
jgi:outer membrane lipoprotein SlyB